MNIYHAVVNNGFIQYNMRDGCLQVFEDRKYAESEHAQHGGEIMPVTVLHKDTAKELVDALEDLLASLTIHDGIDALGRAKGTWSQEARVRTKAAIAKTKGA